VKISLRIAVAAAALAVPAALVVGTTGANAAASAPTTAVAARQSLPGGVIEKKAEFTPDQQAALRDYLNSPRGQARVRAALGDVSPDRPGSIDTLVEGGKDGDHWWIKISMGEIAGTGIATACKVAFPEIGWFVCPPLGAAVRQAVDQNPNAGGVWAELYTNGTVRAGTW
jgi:hypothetical protein